MHSFIADDARVLFIVSSDICHIFFTPYSQSQIVTTLVCHTLVPQSTFPLFGSTAWLIALILVMVVMCSVAVAVRIHR